MPIHIGADKSPVLIEKNQCRAFWVLLDVIGCYSELKIFAILQLIKPLIEVSRYFQYQISQDVFL